MAKRIPSAAVRKRILAAIRDVGKTGTVTNQMVLKHLKSIGQGASMSDVQAIVKEYREESEAHAATMSAVPPMPEEVIELNEKVWSLIWKKADEPVAAIKAHYAAELEKRKLLDEERDSDMLAVEADLEAATARAEKAEAELAHLKENLTDAKMDIARLEGRLRERERDIVSRTELSKQSQKPGRPTEDIVEAPLVQEDGNQLDMFPTGKTEKKMPDDPEPIAAE